MPEQRREIKKIATSKRPDGQQPTVQPTLYDVAREASVSTATVSRVLHGQDRVRQATRERVLGVIEALGYVPDAAAQSMARQRKEVIGLLAVGNRSPGTEVEREGLLFIDEVWRGVEDALGRIEWSLLISMLNSRDPERAFQRMLRVSAKVDGLLITEGMVGSGRLGQLAARTPLVLIAGSPDEPHADVFAADNRSGTVALVSHLIERHGTGRIFSVPGPPGAPDAVARQAALEQTVARYPGVRLTGMFPGWFGSADGQRAGREILGLPRADWPDAIVCGNDQMAIGVIRELQAAGVRVPADVAVVGFDDLHAGALMPPPLTTVRQQIGLLADRACTRLLDRIANPALPRMVELLPTELVIRESCGC
ncbi:MAG TPA: LacI family DNA-binding transcriptional regulator [Streptosporangiaceae bacterium]